jgi:hypothetical protein
MHKLPFLGTMLIVIVLGIVLLVFIKPHFPLLFGALFYLDSAKESVETKRRRATDEVDEKKAA